MLPELLELVDESVLQLVKGRENDIREVLADMSEDLRGLVQFWTVGGQIERLHVLWPAHLAATMTARAVQHNPDRTFSQLVTQMLQEDLQALAFHGWQQEKDTCARGGFDRGIQPEPLVLVLHEEGEDVPPTDTSADARGVMRPKRPSSKATMRFSGGCLTRFPKFF